MCAPVSRSPCIVKVTNAWILVNPGDPPTPDKPGISVVDSLGRASPQRELESGDPTSRAR
jgi:hypothetical protein